MEKNNFIAMFFLDQEKTIMKQEIVYFLLRKVNETENPLIVDRRHVYKRNVR